MWIAVTVAPRGEWVEANGKDYTMAEFVAESKADREHQSLLRKALIKARGYAKLPDFPRGVCVPVSW
jgi:hypothetical protein